MSGTIKLGKYLSIDKDRLINIEPDTTYTIAGVQNYGKGVLNKRVVKGFDLTMKKYQVIKPNQLMWCKVDTKNGAFGITTDEHEGSLASTNMCLANINTFYLNPDFLQLLFTNQWFYNSITEKSTGTTNRQYLTPQQLFEQVEIPDFDIFEQEEFLIRYRSLKDSGIFEELDQQQTYLQLLRQTILQEAVQGKLTKQDPTDEPATELLKRIKAEKEKLNSSGASARSKKEKQLPPITADEIPFELPEGWIWCRLDQVGQINPRNTFEDDKEVSFVPMTYLSSEFGIAPKQETRKWKEVKSAFTHFAENDVAVAKITPCFENSKAGIFKGLINGIGAGTTELHIFRGSLKCILPDYVYLFFKSPDFLKKGESKMTGSAGQKRVPSDYIKNCLFPLPPFAEQQRIVAKVQQLQQQLSQLEAQVQQSRQYAQQLLQSVLKEAFEQKAEVHEMEVRLKY